jgi:predicted phosphodiesterase
MRAAVRLRERMRVLHLSDTHLGAAGWARGAPRGWSRADDHLAAFRRLLSTPADLIVHTGDVFDRSRPPASAIRAAVDLLVATARRVPVVLLAGNHDRRGLLPSLPSHVPGLTVIDEAQGVRVAGLQLAIVPYVDVAHGWAHLAGRAVGGGADLLLCHQAFDGARVPSFTFRVGVQRDTIGPEHLPVGVRYILCGHIHPRQDLPCGDATVVMPGSTERTSFTEADEAKSALLWNLGRRVRWDPIDAMPRPMVRVTSPMDLGRVGPGTLVRVADGPQRHALEALAFAAGAWCTGRPPDAPPPRPRPPRAQLGLFGS